MIDPDKRSAIYLLHEEGMSQREIAGKLHVSRNTVRVVITAKGAMPEVTRKDKVHIDPDLLRRLYQDCEGYVQRLHEILTEEKEIKVSYSTLTRLLRELGISKKANADRCHQVPDEPGVEMQHDTTLYTIRLGERSHKITASLLYLRYSKRRYLKFYRGFNRFKMKCFFHEALTFWGYSAAHCIIDNTNLARLRGTGAVAVIVPEMVSFSRQYGFEFRCHELRHPNRKAGEERSFWTVETNFLPGRTFESLEDLNEQALRWATDRLENRPQGKAGLIPAKAFEHERSCLTALVPHLPEPYQIHSRDTDQYGYIAFEANYYWVPQTRGDGLQILRYADHLKIYHRRQCLAQYPLPADGVKNQKFSPEGQPTPPHGPKNRKRPTWEEEKRLRAMAPCVEAYLDWILPRKGLRRHRFLRMLLALSRKMTPELFHKSIERAGRYRIEDIETIERIARLYLQAGTGELPAVVVDEDYIWREAYQEGELTEAPDLSAYEVDNMPEEDVGPSKDEDADKRNEDNRE